MTFNLTVFTKNTGKWKKYWKNREICQLDDVGTMILQANKVIQTAAFHFLESSYYVDISQNTYTVMFIQEFVVKFS